LKGQVFLLTAGIIIAVLVALRGYSVVQQISAEKEILDISLENLAFKNIETEVKQLPIILANGPRNITDNSIDFLNFTRIGSDGHSLDFRSLFVGVLANSTNQTMNITIFQFLRESNLNVTIRLNTSTEQTNTTLLNDSAIWINNFTFTAGGKYNLTLILPDKNYQENITIETKTNKDTYTAFFDLRLLTERATHINRFQQGIKIS
jgi:hypothetical protein